jgi:hypothetical protein
MGLKLHVLLPKMNILSRTFHKLHKNVNMFPIIIRSQECHHILVWRQHWPYRDFVLFEIFTQNLIVKSDNPYQNVCWGGGGGGGGGSANRQRRPTA